MTDQMIHMLEESKLAAAQYRCGLITRKQALEVIEPYAELFNRKAAEIAKKYNRKPQKFSLAGFLR
jgi:hypothetical protein